MSKFVTGLVTLAVIGGGIAYANNYVNTEVVRVVDGDTLVARVKGSETTIRLLNVDTPETKDPNKPVECMGTEATEFLEARLPPGTRINLEYDTDRTDDYGRTLAAVYESGSLVNAEIAAAGLGVAVLFEPNRRFYDEVRAAELSAQSSEKGLFDPAAGCTIPAQWQKAMVLTPVISETSFDSHAEAMDAITTASRLFTLARGALNALIGKGSGDSVESRVYRELEATHRARYDARFEQAQEGYLRLLAEDDGLKAAEELAAAEQQEKAERAAKEKAERVAKEKAQRAAKAKIKHAEKKTSKKHTKKKKKKKYTGPRCYAPGGKTWRPC